MLDLGQLCPELDYAWLLERLQAAAAAQQRTGSVIEVRVMQALALAACDDEAGALAALADALTLAAPEGYVRVFVDDGPPMAALFARLMTARSARAMLAGGVPVDYLGRLREDLHPDGGSLRGPCGLPLGWPRARPSH